MERFAQLLDDFEDIVYAFGLLWERIKSKLKFATFVFLSLSLQGLGVVLAISRPPLAVALATLLLVWLLYQAVVSGTTRRSLST